MMGLSGTGRPAGLARASADGAATRSDGAPLPGSGARPRAGAMPDAGAGVGAVVAS
ncbi:hypothetical protein [Nonomuraea sp. NPDC049725]|uniref:hypothetical protein n=1 Tax=Nonomuraea sp. NPDC049725 TaxID=3154508 RepID=UPI003413E372